MSGSVISMVKCATDTKTRDIGFGLVLEAIRTGGKTLRGQILEIRNRFEAELRKNGGERKAAKLAVDPLKKALPAVTLSGRFSYRANDKLIEHSGFLCADLDDLGSRLVSVWEKLKTSPHVRALFRSPTGHGIKVVFKVPAEGDKHPGSYRAVEKLVRELTGVQIDQKCKEVARLCFLSYDTQLFVNENATELAPLPEPEKPKPTAANGDVPRDLPLRERIATQLFGSLKYSAEKGGYFCKCPGEANHTNSTGKKHTIVYLDKVPTLDCQHTSCKAIVDAFSAQLRSEIGKAERQDRREASRVQADLRGGGEPVGGEPTGADSELTSLTPLEADVFPAPLEEAAFYGFAGRFVGRVFPCTEADRAALLFTFLVTFGNVIGRTAHAIADGARHYCNLNAVLVGPTGKGRKGSARWHTNRLFGCVDEEWVENCTASGLSSGEGLIAAVQDTVTKTVKNKKTGKYEEQIVVAGKTDKRLLVIQTEFSTALKMMEREGNILSSVIRAAWDCEPKLRTLTKNSPTCATNPHISIIGHITAEELRPGLSEIEAANGFGNRFLWVPVKRSKELPEGGELPAISDLIEPLQNAVEFARLRKEPLKRDEAAREFWASIYHDLSAGQIGLFGAITARSEAQCLRLSDIYALLDCSPHVGVEHLQAALAAWRYCENGARWIFRTGTGNKGADRILSALKVAGEKGLTKWQVSSEIFNRHATKFEIEQALRTLYHQKLANRVVENTRGRSAERWFSSASTREESEISEVSSENEVDTSLSSHTSQGHSENASSAEPDSGGSGGDHQGVSEKSEAPIEADEEGVGRL